jgi:hypothetical protein
MFKEFFKKMFNKEPNLPDEEVREINIEINNLKNEIDLREKQVEKLTLLANKQDEFQKRYLDRILIHNKVILEKKERLDILQIRLLGG